MKKIYTFCLLSIAFLGAAVAQTGNNLEVFSDAGEKFFLILNGKKYNEKAETNVLVTGLTAANYKAKIIFEQKMSDVNSNVYLMWEGKEVSGKLFTYNIVKKDGKRKLKFVSVSDIPNAGGQVNSTGTVSNTSVNTSATTGQQTVSSGATVDPNTGSVSTSVNTGAGNQSTTVNTTTTTNGTGTQANPNGGFNMSMGGLGMPNINININGADGNSTGTTTNSSSYSTTTTTTTSGVNTNNGNTSTTATTTTTAPAAGTCLYAMSSADFNKAKGSIESKSFEDSKMTLAKQIISKNCVNAEQVKELLGLFSFEKTKVDFAKYAYKFTVDKNNYYVINDAFSFESSIKEVDDYISKQ